VSATEREEIQFRHDSAKSRREFLKIAGIAGAAVGLGTGLGGLVTACGEETTTTTGGVTTTAGVTSTAGATTTVSTAAATSRPVKIGLTTPRLALMQPLRNPWTFSSTSPKRLQEAV
jgi:hypothetical protein